MAETKDDWVDVPLEAAPVKDDWVDVPVEANVGVVEPVYAATDSNGSSVPGKTRADASAFLEKNAKISKIATQSILNDEKAVLDTPQKREFYYRDLQRRGYDYDAVKVAGEQAALYSKDFQAGKKMLDTDDQALEYVAGVLANTGQYDEALPLYTKLVQKKPKSATANYGMAFLLNKLGQGDLSKQYMAAAQQHAGDAPEPLAQLGISLETSEEERLAPYRQRMEGARQVAEMAASPFTAPVQSIEAGVKSLQRAWEIAKKDQPSGNKIEMLNNLLKKGADEGTGTAFLKTLQGAAEIGIGAAMSSGSGLVFNSAVQGAQMTGGEKASHFVMAPISSTWEAVDPEGFAKLSEGERAALTLGDLAVGGKIMHSLGKGVSKASKADMTSERVKEAAETLTPNEAVSILQYPESPEAAKLNTEKLDLQDAIQSPDLPEDVKNALQVEADKKDSQIAPLVEKQMEVDHQEAINSALEAKRESLRKALEKLPNATAKAVIEKELSSIEPKPKEDATQEIIKPESVQAELESGDQGRKVEETGVSDSVQRSAEGKEEVAPPEEIKVDEQPAIPAADVTAGATIKLETDESQVKKGRGRQGKEEKEVLTTAAPAPVVESAGAAAETVKRINTLSEYESQGYNVVRLRELKQDMLEDPKRAQAAFDIYDYARKKWGKLGEDMEKTPLGSVMQFFYGEARSVPEFIKSQIEANKSDIASSKKYIDSLGKSKGDVASRKMSEESIAKREAEIKDYEKDLNENTGVAAEKPADEFNIDDRVIFTKKDGTKKVGVWGGYSGGSRAIIWDGKKKHLVEVSDVRHVQDRTTDVDLKGNKKEDRMLTFDEYFEKEKPNLPENGKYAEAQSRERHKKIIQDALEAQYTYGKKRNKTLQDDVAEGRITAGDAKAIIESAGLEVPKEILNAGKPSLAEIKSDVIEKAAEAVPKAKKEGVPLKVQKDDLLGQIQKAIDVVVGDQKEHYEAMKGNDVGSILTDSAFGSDANIALRLKEAGFNVSKEGGHIQFEVEGDGTFNLLVRGLDIAKDEVQKHWPTSNAKPVGIRTGNRMPSQKAIGKYSTRAEAEQSKTDALENLETAKKSGNKAALETYQKQAELESEAYKDALSSHESTVAEIERAEEMLKSGKVDSLYDVERVLELPEKKKEAARFEGKPEPDTKPDYEFAKTHLKRLWDEATKEFTDYTAEYRKKDGTLKSSIPTKVESRIARMRDEIEELQNRYNEIEKLTKPFDLESENKKAVSEGFSDLTHKINAIRKANGITDARKNIQDFTPEEIANTVQRRGDAKRIRSKKIDGVGMHVDFGITKTLYNSALELAAKQVESGTKVGKAIQNAIRFIDEHFKGREWNRAAFARHLNDRYKIKVGTREVEVQRDDSKQAAEVINGFYSPLEQGILDAKTEKTTGKDWAKRLKGATEGDEIRFTGLDRFLEENADKSLTKKEVQDFLKNNRIEVVEVVKGDFDRGKLRVEQTASGNWDIYYDKERVTTVDKLDAKTEEEAIDVGESMFDYEEPITKYHQYQLPGAKSDYKEILVTLPVDASMGSKPRQLGGQTFRSSHFDEPNILAHLRMNTRTAADGKKTLFIEEMQSDWGQMGKRKGFGESISVTTKDGIVKGRFDNKLDAEKFIKDSGRNDLQIIEEPYRQGVPEAPFVTNTPAWVKLGWKVALKEAVKQGAERIAWTTGEQQNARYDLSKQVDHIDYIKTPEGQYKLGIVGKDGDSVPTPKERYSAEELPDVVGKEVAEKIVNGEGEPGGGRMTLRNVDLQVGGKGMIGFYGSPKEGKTGIVGSVAESLTGQRAKETKIETNETKSQTGDIETLERKGETDGGDPIYESESGNYAIGKGEDLNGRPDHYDVFVDNKKVGSAITLEDANKLLNDNLFSSKRTNVQHSIDITPEIKSAVEKGLPLFKGLSKTEISKAKLDAAATKLSNKLRGGLQSGGLNALPEFVEYVRAFIEHTSNKVEDFIKHWKEAFPKSEFSDKELTDAFNEVKGEKKPVTEYADPEMTKMANAIKDAEIEGKFGVEALDRVLSKLQDTDLQQIYNSVKAKIKSGAIDVAKVRERVLKEQHGSESDQAALLYDAAELKAKEDALTKQINAAKTMEEKIPLQDKLIETQNAVMDNAIASRSIGRSASTIFRLRQVWVDKSVNEHNMLEEYQASKGLDKLTAEQQEYVRSQYNKLRELEAKIKDLREEQKTAFQETERLRKENEVLKSLKEKSTAQRKVDRHLKTGAAIERSNSRIQKSKDRLRQLRSTMSSGVNPEVAIEIGKIAAEKVYQGAVKFDEVVRNVLDEIKDVFPQFTEKDIQEHLAYSKKSKPRTDESLITSVTKKIAKIKEKTDAGDFTTPERTLKEKSKELRAAEREYARARLEWDAARRKDMMANAPAMEKIKDKILRWQRFAVLSYIGTLGKLAAVVGHNLILKPFRFAAQSAIYNTAKTIAPKFAGKLQIYGDPKLSSLAKYYGEFFRNFSGENFKEQMKGQDVLEQQYGRPFMYDEWKAASGWMEIPGRSHGYIKSFVKRPEFEYAQNQITQWHLDKSAEIEKALQNPDLTAEERTQLEKQAAAVDVTNPDVQERIGRLSLEHGKWGILMNENNFVTGLRNLMDKGGMGGFLLKTELPILKIPTNYVERAFATKFGLVMALTGKKWGYSQHPGIVELMYKGTKDLTPEQADLLAKTIMQGTIGATLFTAGYLNAKNITESDDRKSWTIFGHKVPEKLLHLPEYESLFSGATTKHKFEGSKKEAEDWIASFVHSDVETLQKMPFSNMVQYGFMGNVIKALETKGKEVDKISDAVAKKMSSMILPGFVKESAKVIDKDKEGYYRKPKGDAMERFWQTFEKDIPGMRHNVKEERIPQYKKQ